MLQALVIEENHGACSVLADQQFQCERHTHRMVNTGYTDTMATRIKNYAFHLLWIHFPMAGVHVREQRFNSCMRTISTWLRLADAAGMPAVLFGTLGRRWEEPEVAALMATRSFKKTYHRMCHFGRRVNPQQPEPSSVCFVAVSNVPLPHHTCRCRQAPVEHRLDWQIESLPLRGQLRQQATLFMIKQLVPLAAQRIYRSGLQRSMPDSTSTSITANAASALTTEEVPAAASAATTGTTSVTLAPEAVLPAVCEVQHASTPDPAELRTSAFPTDERVRWKQQAKERKARGEKPKTRIKEIEEHYDDCGTDLTGLKVLPSDLADEMLVEHVLDSGSDDDDSTLPIWWLRGSSAAPPTPSSHSVYHATSLDEFIHMMDNEGSSLDIVEICGGAGRTSTISGRRHLKVGNNFDLTTECDLNDPRNQRMVLQYLADQRPLVVVMAPTCTPFGPMANVNWHINYDGWRRSYDLAAPHGRFCGRVAMAQHRAGRHWLAEQPFPSRLWEEPPWPEVRSLPNCHSIVLDQCMVGQVGPRGLPAKKPTEIVASHPALLTYLADLRCNGAHVHDNLESGGSERCKLWTWDMASRIADGIVLLRRLVGRPSASAFPSMATGTEAGEPSSAGAASSGSGASCPGCRSKRNKADPSHTRVPGVCRYPFEEARLWPCPGCSSRKPSGHHLHNYNSGECRWAIGGDARMRG